MYFGHAVSTDLINWEVKEPVLQTKEGEWDEYQVWAPHVIYHEGEYWMFYTGVNNNVAQAIGLAKSRDLYHWERW
jgi:beta-xylosidase